jgi:Na+/H+ antiporter NhaD/arsenite permease-like protein
MNDFIDYIARLGIVRVLSVPVFMAVIMYLLYRWAAPPEDLGEIESEERRA